MVSGLSRPLDSGDYLGVSTMKRKKGVEGIVDEWNDGFGVLRCLNERSGESRYARGRCAARIVTIEIWRRLVGMQLESIGGLGE